VSQNNIPTSLATIQKLLQRVSSAEKSQQREIRISIEEARALTIELALLTTRLGSTVAEIHTLLRDIQKTTTEVDVKFDGGSF
jgi:regulator of replication initiation timing